MTASRTRKSRGMRTQVVAADFLRPVYPDVWSVPAGYSGADLKKTPGLAIEVKATSRFTPLEWMRQAVRNAAEGELPAALYRPNGYGEARVSEWLILQRFGDFRRWWLELQLLRRWAQDVDRPGYAALLDTVNATLKEVPDVQGL